MIKEGIFLKNKFQQWVKKRAASGNPQTLKSKQIYILPSGFGVAFITVLITLAIGAINYQLNPGFMLAFFMVSLTLLAMWESHRNVKGLMIKCFAIKDTEQGKSARISFFIRHEKPQSYGLSFSFPGSDDISVESVTNKGTTIHLPLQTPIRGRFILPPLTVKSTFPLGLFNVWSTLFFEVEYYVYPAALSPGFWPEKDAALNESHDLSYRVGEEELYELKSVANPWIQTGRIAWKISARGQGWYLKTMTSPTGENWLFRIEDTASENVEINLQQLSYWLQTAEKQGHAYGLALNGSQTVISHGKEHLHDCLRQLATYAH